MEPMVHSSAAPNRWALDGRLVGYWLLVAIGYGALVVVAVRLGALGDGTIVLWLPAGFALAAVLLLGYRIWPGIVAGMVVPPLLMPGVSLGMVWLTPGAVLGAVLSAWLVQRWVPSNRWLVQLADSTRFMLLVVMGALAAALLDGLLGWWRDGGKPLGLVQWWLGNVAGVLVFAPLVMAWAVPAQSYTAARAGELVLLVLLSLATAQVVFSGVLPTGSLVFVLLAFFLWAALRLDVRGMSTLTLLTTLVATYHTLRGQGPFVVASELVSSLTLQAFVLVGAVTGLILSAFTHERDAALEAARLAAKVIEYTPDGVMITDPQLRIHAVNPAFSATTGYAAAEVLGKTPRVLASGRHDADFYRAMWRTILVEGRWQGEIWNRRKNGEIYLEWLNIVAIRDDHGKVLYYAGIFSDIVTQEHVRKRLHSLAYHDALTDLPNRELFQDRLHNALIQARRDGKPVGVMFLDVDFFKAVNDTHGHAIGDRLLRAVALALRRCVRRSDTVARLGGDEFTVVLTHISGADDAVQVATKIIAAFSRPFRVEGLELVVGVSIGIALFPEDGQEPDELLRHADVAMYAAKQAGRNNYQRYQTQMSMASTAEMEASRQRAVDR